MPKTGLNMFTKVKIFDHNGNGISIYRSVGLWPCNYASN